MQAKAALAELLDLIWLGRLAEAQERVEWTDQPSQMALQDSVLHARLSALHDTKVHLVPRLISSGRIEFIGTIPFPRLRENGSGIDYFAPPHEKAVKLLMRKDEVRGWLLVSPYQRIRQTPSRIELRSDEAPAKAAIDLRRSRTVISLDATGQPSKAIDLEQVSLVQNGFELKLPKPVSTSLSWDSPVEVRVKGARGVRLMVALDQPLPPGVLLSFADSDGRQYPAIEVKDQGYWSPTIAGESVHVLASDSRSPIGISISSVLEIAPLEGQATISSPNPLVDASCKTSGNTKGTPTDPNIVKTISAAVGLLSLVKSLPDGTRANFICTGSRVESRRDPSGFYILTANHCYAPVPSNNIPVQNGNPADVATTEVFWDYKTQTCSPGDPPFFSYQQLMQLPRSYGGELLGANFQTDVLLFKTGPAPGLRGSLGWQVDFWPGNWVEIHAHRVSHPNGRSQAYLLEWINWDPIPTRACNSLPVERFIYGGPAEGYTYPGSSGSALVNRYGRIIGQLYGTCNKGIRLQVDGALSKSWPSIGRYLE